MSICIKDQIQNMNIVIGCTVGCTSVSYTHLDVYKRQEYRQTTAVVYWEHLGSGYSRIRHKKSSIDVRFEANETLQYGKSLPYAFNEHEGDKIQIAYREYNGEILDVSRSTIIVDGRMVMALFGLFWACVMCLLRSDDRGS